MYIFDIDGTLADCGHRIHLINEKPTNWKLFYAKCIYDSPIQSIIDIAIQLSYRHKIIMSTGRSDDAKSKTIEWLFCHNVPCDGLYMRKAGDNRPDYIVKAELLTQIEGEYCINGHTIEAIFEDRQQVVDMYRAKGLKVLQVDKGDF